MQPRQIEVLEFVPVGHHDGRIGSLSRGIGVVLIVEVWQQAASTRHSDRIVGPHDGALGLQQLRQRHRRRVAQIVRIGLEREAQQRQRAVFQRAEEVNQLLDHS